VIDRKGQNAKVATETQPPSGKKRGKETGNADKGRVRTHRVHSGQRRSSAWGGKEKCCREKRLAGKREKVRKSGQVRQRAKRRLFA